MRSVISLSMVFAMAALMPLLPRPVRQAVVASTGVEPNAQGVAAASIHAKAKPRTVPSQRAEPEAGQDLRHQRRGCADRQPHHQRGRRGCGSLHQSAACERAALGSIRVASWSR